MSWSEHIRFADIDRGKIIGVSMPQEFQVECRYVNTFLKMLFYALAHRRSGDLVKL